MSASSLGEKLVVWAAGEASVELLVLIGSRTREPASVAAADLHSDWDFQLATSRPEAFATDRWLSALGVDPLAYVLRMGRLGSAQKVSAVTKAGELDLVIIPVQSLRGLAELLHRGHHSSHPLATQALTDLSAVLAGGYRILKGAAEFAGFYEQVSREIPPARLDAAAVCQLAEAFVCDYVFTCRKLERGELCAAQRWLHQQLAETNFRLLHELRLRGGCISFPDARRLERLGEPRLGAVTVTAGPTVAALRVAVEGAAEAHRHLVAELVGAAWRWPDLSGLHLRAE